MKKIFILSIISIVICIACVSQKVNQTSTDLLYKKENNELNCKFLVYHINDSVSRLYYEISNEHLLYKRLDSSIHYYSHVKLQLSISSENEINNKAELYLADIKDKQTDDIIKQLKGNVLFTLKKGSSYYLDLNVLDVNKKVKYTQSLFSDKSSNDCRQNFLITNSRNEVLFSNYYKPDEVVYIQSERNQAITFEVDYFKSKFKMALPPFSLEQMPHFTYKPDSVFTVSKSKERIELSLPSTGFFHLKTNNQEKTGVSFFVFENSYPKIKNIEQMVLSTRYIMAKKEYENVLYSSNQKASIDKYWLDVGGSNERAKELIRKYYNRVQESNKLFTSYQEGWKTDRGMIYVVFGAPNRVTKRKNGEIWLYGEGGSPISTLFSFVKVINPFSDNDYYLERNETFKEPWYQAVDQWRQGKIYLDN